MGHNVLTSLKKKQPTKARNKILIESGQVATLTMTINKLHNLSMTQFRKTWVYNPLCLQNMGT